MSKTSPIVRALKYIIKGIPIKRTNVTVGEISPSSRLTNKKVVITGGNRGIGFSIAKKCIAEGAKVLIAGRNKETLEKTSAELHCLYLVYDVTEFKGIPEFIEQSAKLLGGIDILINNAGVSFHEKGIKEVTFDGWDSQFDTNIKAPYFLSKEFLNFCEKTNNNNAHILCITSERGLYGDDIPYGLTKAAINSLTKGLSCKFAKKGIRVNAIAPGVTVSDMTGYADNNNLYRPSTIGGRVFLAEEVAEITVFILSDASKCISGEIIPCNQGNHLRHK